MKYLYVMDGGSSFEQSNDEPSQEALEHAYNGELEILQFEQSRGFCRALVERQETQGEEDQDEFTIKEWERVDVHVT